MDIHNLFSLALRFWPVTGILYLLLCAGTVRWINHYFGYPRGYKVVGLSIGLPIAMVMYALKFGYQLYTYPGRVRNRRLLKEIFDIADLGDGIKDEMERMHFQKLLQVKVDAELAARASIFFSHCQDQERVRKTGNKRLQRGYDLVVKFSKSQFWLAFHVAEVNGFIVRPRISDYTRFETHDPTV